VNFIVQVLRGHDITIYGDGMQSRAFCYVDDMIDGLVRLMKSPDDVTGPLNLGNPEEITMRELAALTIQQTGSRSKIVHRPLPQDDPRQRRPARAQCQAGRRSGGGSPPPWLTSRPPKSSSDD